MNKIGTMPRTIAEAGKLLKQKEISPSELVTGFLEQIETTEPNVKAWVRVQKEEALQHAKHLEQTLNNQEELPPLFAIPYGAKDIIYTKGLETEGGSKSTEGFKPVKDATVVRTLHQAGAVLLGKTTTTEFANWGNPPETRNPWNLNHTPGGSSSGSAAAVASNMALFSLGTQTAGSLSRPAAYNGLTVLKGTYGRVSKSGVIPASWSLDHVGAFTKNVEDAIIVYNEIAGPDKDDFATWSLPKQKLIIQEQTRYTIGVIEDAYFEADADSMKAYQETLTLLQELGYTLKTIPMPKSFKAANAAQHIVMKTETSSYHYDNFQKNASLYGSYLQGFIKEGLQITANDYLKAQRIRTLFKQQLTEVFEEVDLLVTPAAPSAAPEGILQTGSPAFNLPFTNAGVPTLAIPMGYTQEKGLPLGLQLIAEPLAEQKLVNVGHLFQKATDWHTRNPGFQR